MYQHERHDIDVLTPDLARLRVAFVNVFFAGAPGGPWALIDTELSIGVAQVLEVAAARYGRETRPSAIITSRSHDRTVLMRCATTIRVHRPCVHSIALMPRKAKPRKQVAIKYRASGLGSVRCDARTAIAMVKLLISSTAVFKAPSNSLSCLLASANWWS